MTSYIYPMKMIKTVLLLTTLAVLTLSCNIYQKAGGHRYLGPQAIIYQTRGDYSKNVPVTLSADKTKIVSYPAPQDLYTAGVLAYPTELAKKYWLDNRGIGPNTAFLKLTYEEYAKLGAAPGPDDLYKLIIDKDPITHMYSLGPRARFKNLVTEADSLIEHHKLKEFKKLK